MQFAYPELSTISLYSGDNALHPTFRLGEFLGSGQFGTVYHGEWATGGQTVPVAIKTLHANSHESDKVRFLQEAAIMGQFKHPNVIKMCGLITEEEPVSEK